MHTVQTHHGWKQGGGGGGGGRGRAGPRAVFSGEISATVRDVVPLHGLTMKEAAQRERAAHWFFSSLKVHICGTSCSSRRRREGGRTPVFTQQPGAPEALVILQNKVIRTPAGQRAERGSSERHCGGSKVSDSSMCKWTFTRTQAALLAYSEILPYARLSSCITKRAALP